jgi:hypothetical protein
MKLRLALIAATAVALASASPAAALEQATYEARAVVGHPLQQPFGNSGEVAHAWASPTRAADESPLSAVSPALPANGLIAFAGDTGDGSSPGDIYVLAPDGTGLRALTSTPELVEYAPTWSPDGSRLAFVRSDVYPDATWLPCWTLCQLVVVDPSTGAETFSADIPQDTGLTFAWVPHSLAWSPDGRAIAIGLAACGVGGCGPNPPGEFSVIADLDSGAFRTFTQPYIATWSPDGEWLVLEDDPAASGPSQLLVPADLIGTGVVVDIAAIAELPGVRPLPHRPGYGVEGWMPDGSALFVSTEAGLDVMTVADGERRTVIAGVVEGVAVSPDGSQIAYMREMAPDYVQRVWVAAVDGSDRRLLAELSCQCPLTTPVWSPDGSLLLVGDEEGWFTVRPDGTGRTEITPFMLRGDHTFPGSPPPGWQPVPTGSSVPTEQPAVDTAMEFSMPTHPGTPIEN